MVAEKTEEEELSLIPNHSVLRDKVFRDACLE